MKGVRAGAVLPSLELGRFGPPFRTRCCYLFRCSEPTCLPGAIEFAKATAFPFFQRTIATAIRPRANWLPPETAVLGADHLSVAVMRSLQPAAVERALAPPVPHRFGSTTKVFFRCASPLPPRQALHRRGKGYSGHLLCLGHRKPCPTVALIAHGAAGAAQPLPPPADPDFCPPALSPRPWRNRITSSICTPGWNT